MTELQTQIESNYLVNQIDFTVYGNPVPQGRPRATTVAGHVTLYDPLNSRQWKQVVQFHASTVVSAPFPPSVALQMQLTFYLPRPKSLSRKVTEHTKRPDLDNLGKAVMDALNKVAYHDDSQIIELHKKKVYTQGNIKPGVRIQIHKAEGKE
ncbi:MAG: RusA family crossover junction endodeoxyribonuclease [Magnetococcales bacterium]|nr:RusA family crossover junction endodeoxyribonuclease [Nitrospirota bacterium]